MSIDMVSAYEKFIDPGNPDQLFPLYLCESIQCYYRKILYSLFKATFYLSLSFYFMFMNVCICFVNTSVCGSAVPFDINETLQMFVQQ